MESMQTPTRRGKSPTKLVDKQSKNRISNCIIRLPSNKNIQDNIRKKEIT